MLKHLVLIHTIIEIAGGIALIFNPKLLMLSGDLSLQTFAVIKLFGVAVLGIGLLSLIFFKQFSYSEWDRKLTMLIMGYHFIQGLQCYSIYTQGVMTNMGALTLHITLAVLFMVLFMKERELFEERLPS